MAKKTLRTKLCDILGIEYPIILAGMGGVSGPQLAAAVSNAGGLGVLGCIQLSPEQVRTWIRKTKSLTDKPFGVDLVMPSTLPESLPIEDLSALLPAEHVAFVNELREELGLPNEKVDRELGWQHVTLSAMKQAFEVSLEERVPVIAAGLGTPDWEVGEAHAHGATMISLVGNIRIARRMAEIGVDIIVAQGHEAGGHTGRIGTMALVPQVVDAVYPQPVVAAGGIGDGRALAASLALGAVGVWVGTRFILTPEGLRDICDFASTEDDFEAARLYCDSWKQRILDANDEETCISKVYTGKTARLLKDKFIERWEKSGMSYLPMPLQGMLVNNLQTAIRKAGMMDWTTAFAGQISGMVKEIKPAGEIVEEMVQEAREILDRLPVEVATT